jgi:hypothetical protein
VSSKNSSVETHHDRLGWIPFIRKPYRSGSALLRQIPSMQPQDGVRSDIAKEVNKFVDRASWQRTAREMVYYHGRLVMHGCSVSGVSLPAVREISGLTRETCIFLLTTLSITVHLYQHPSHRMSSDDSDRFAQKKRYPENCRWRIRADITRISASLVHRRK